MAKKIEAGAPATQIDPDAEYRVKLTRTVPFAGTVLRPSDDIRVKGKVLAALGDAVEAYEKV